MERLFRGAVMQPHEPQPPVRRRPQTRPRAPRPARAPPGSASLRGRPAPSSRSAPLTRTAAPRSSRASRQVAASRAARAARAAGCPGPGQARGHPGPATAGYRAREVSGCPGYPEGSDTQGLVRAAAAFAVASRALARLERASCWRCSWDSPPVPPTSDPLAGCRPGCPAAGSPAWCPGSGSAPAPGCRGPPRPAAGSRRRMVRRNQGASRDRLRMPGCRPRGGPPALVPTEVDRAAPAVAPMRAAPTPRSPPEHCPSAGRRALPPGRLRASLCSPQASLRDTA